MLILFPLLSLIILFFLTKLMGYRQITQLNMYDYINGITLGSIASEFIMSDINNYQKPLVGMIVYGVVIFLMSKITQSSLTLRKIIEGEAIILYEKDTILFDSLKKAKLDLNEFFMMCRIDGYYDISEVDTIILETNGRFSYIPKTTAVTCQDLNISKKSVPPHLLMLEGQIYLDNLKACNLNIKWLESQIKAKGYKYEDVKVIYIDSKERIHILNNNTMSKKYK